MNTIPNSMPWFSLQYTTAAPAGLPPYIQASRVFKYADDEGVWVVALWDNLGADPQAPSRCILRVPTDQVSAVTEHASLAEAAAHLEVGETVDNP